MDNYTADKFDLAIIKLCEKLDEELYIPVKAELAGKGQHSLGMRKENFKIVIQEEIDKLR